MKTINDIINSLKNDIERVSNAILDQTLCVVIWESAAPVENCLNVTYALCNRVCNKIGEAQDVTVFPSLDLVRFLPFNEALKIAQQRSNLYNGRNDRFRSSVVCATKYRHMLLDELNRQLGSVQSLAGSLS